MKGLAHVILRWACWHRESGVGMMRIYSRWILMAGAVAAVFAGVSASHAQQAIGVGWTIPAEESKCWMMRRPAEFPDLGKTYNVEWTQFQGTAPMTQALAAGALDCATQAPLSLANGVVGGNLKAYIVAQHVFEKPGGFSVYWAVKDDSPIKTIADLKDKTIGISVIGGGTYRPFAMLLKKNGVDPAKDIKLVEVGFAVSEDALRQGRVDAVNMTQTQCVLGDGETDLDQLDVSEDALRQGRVDAVNMNQPFAA